MEILYVVLGWLSFHCLVMIEIHNDGGSNNPFLYLKNRPLKVVLSLLGAVLGYLLTDATLPSDTAPALVILAYAGVGYAPYHIFEIISKHKKTEPMKVSSKKIEEAETVQFE